MIVWISSYPFSGASLVREILKECFQLETYSRYERCDEIFRPEEELRYSLHPIRSGRKWDAFYNDACASKNIVPILTFGKDIDCNKAIYVVRDPRDAINFHALYGSAAYKEEVNIFDLILGAPPTGGWGAHVSDWRPWGRDRTLVLRLEDLLREPSKSVDEIGKFLGAEPHSAGPIDFSVMDSAVFYRVPCANHTIGPDEEALISALYGREMGKFSYDSGSGVDAKALASLLKKQSKEKQAIQYTLGHVRDNFQELIVENDKLQRRVSTLEHIVEPRLSSILKLRPLRYALEERNRIKRRIAKSQSSDIHKGRDEKPFSKTRKIQNAQDIILYVNTEVANRDLAPSKCSVENIGIAVFAHDRATNIASVLKALELQGALGLTHVWIDGDHGNPAKRARVDLVQDCVFNFDVKKIHRNRGNFGFRKMMLLSMRYMMEHYDRIIFLEDDCFPAKSAVSGFDAALTEVERNDQIFSVYGHPFMFPGEEDGTYRFQGWGWATTARKLRSLWDDLMNCYLMTEEEYLSFVDDNLTPEIEKLIDVTPGRQPSETIRKFFAWDETLCLLAAMRGMKHKRTKERLIYNFGAGAGAAHFHQVDYFRQPPFNMISIDELWDHY